MEETKENGTVTQFATDEESHFDQHVTPEKKGSPEDQRDMYRMGKAQELRVWS
jgi:hypothetical protein